MEKHIGHETVICSECYRIIEQRLGDEMPRYIVCDDCHKNPEQLDQVSRAAEVAAASLIDLVSVIERAFVRDKDSHARD